MHFCRAHIAIGGDMNNIYYAGDFAPVSWPEIQVIQHVHGDHAVDQIEPFAWVDQSPREERIRLLEKYGEAAVSAVYAKQNPAEMDAPGVVKLKVGTVWQDPISREVRTVEAEPEPQEAFVPPAAFAPPNGTPRTRNR